MTMAPAAEVAAGPVHPIRGKFGRRKFDKQPTQRAAVLIASNGVKIPGAAIRQALRLSAGEPVAVVTIARIYGSSLGLPNPGLLPTRKEMAEQKGYVQEAVAALERGGVEAWGQVAASRKPVKTIAQAAAARGVRHVFVVREEQPVRWRRVVEGDLAKEIARKLGGAVPVEGVAP
jgi:alkylated DNA nucleotide flippase Atl1